MDDRISSAGCPEAGVNCCCSSENVSPWRQLCGGVLESGSIWAAAAAAATDASPTQFDHLPVCRARYTTRAADGTLRRRRTLRKLYR